MTCLIHSVQKNFIHFYVNITAKFVLNNISKYFTIPFWDFLNKLLEGGQER